MGKLHGIHFSKLPQSIREIANVTIRYEHDADQFSDSVNWPLFPAYDPKKKNIGAIRTGKFEGHRVKALSILNRIITIIRLRTHVLAC